VIAAAETCFDREKSEFILSGLQTLEQLAKKCIELLGYYMYVDKIPSLATVVYFLHCRAKDLSAPLVQLP
jgi:hypothetical protein